MKEILQASGYAALVYLLFNYLVTFGSGRPLHDAINPNRRFLPIFSLGIIGAAVSLLVQAHYQYDIPHLDLVMALFNKNDAKPQVIGAVSFIVFGLAVLMLWVWCWWKLPRDPRTFSLNPKDLIHEYRKALGHYVRWTGGIDYAFLCEVREGVHTVIAEGTDDLAIARGVSRLPATGSAIFTTDTEKAVAFQKERWKIESRRIFDELPHFDDMVHSVGQGKNVTICFDVRYGAFYFEVLERPDDAGQAWLYLFGACLNEHEVHSMVASQHYYTMSRAIRYIRSGVTRR